MKKCFFGAIAVLALASCSNEKVVELSQDQEIKLTVEAGKATSRAADGYCPANLPAEFDVWAKQGASNYFAAEPFKQSGSTLVINTEDKRYWPANALQMFAMKNYLGDETTKATVTWDATQEKPLKVNNFIVPNAVGSQKDFIYAVNAAATKDANKLNFRHGLAEVVFRAQNLNPNIYVEVTGVKVMNVQNKGTFTFPTTSTDANVKDDSNPQDKEDMSLVGKTQGSWSVVTGSLDSYTVTLPETVKVSQSATKDTPVSLTYNFIDNNKRYNANSLYLMEQQGTKVWNGTDALKKAGEGEGAQKVYDTECGAYLILTCSIWNVAAGNGSEKATSDVALWTGKDIAVKLPALAWKHGYKYVYTFKFTKDGNGGTDPDTDEPVFTPIELTVDVDDFVNETDTPVNMVR